MKNATRSAFLSLILVVALGACAPGKRARASGAAAGTTPREYKDALDSERAAKFVEMYRHLVDAETRANQLQEKLNRVEAEASRLRSQNEDLLKMRHPARAAYPDEEGLETREPVITTAPVDAATQQDVLVKTLREELQAERKRRAALEDEMDALRTAADPDALKAVKDGSALRSARAEIRELKEQLAAARQSQPAAAPPATPQAAPTDGEEEEKVVIERVADTSAVASLQAELEAERKKTAQLEAKLKVAEKVAELIFRRDQAGR